MAKLAQIRLAGTIAVTALCAAAANAAVAQDRGLVLNNQLQLGDVVAGHTLNVVDVSDQVTVSTAAQGNSQAGGADGQDLDVRSTQAGEAGSDAGVVSYRVRSVAPDGTPGGFSETARFARRGRRWVYVDGDITSGRS